MSLIALSADVVARLPTPKGVAHALTLACRREDVNLEQIASLVRTDPALSGRLLALANSAAAGGRNVNSIDEAISRTGLVAVSQIALAFSLIDQHSSGFCTNFNYAGFWSQSLLMAAASREFGALRKLGAPAELFTLGLFAQVGTLALATAYPKEYSALLAKNSEGAALRAQETALAGLDHLQLSVGLMTQWGIARANAEPFGFHEEPAKIEVPGAPAGRSQLAHSAWRVAVIISNKGINGLLDGSAGPDALAWLELEPEVLRVHLVEIETVWRLWLALISRHS